MEEQAPPTQRPGARHVSVGEDQAGQRLDKFLRGHAPGAPQGLIHKWVRTGQVRVDGKRARSDARLAAGQDVRLPPMDPPPKTGVVNPKDAEFIKRLVLFQDDSVIALSKPCGLAVQGGTGTRRHLAGMLPALEGDGSDTPRLVHRLDRDTSGALLLARTAGAARALGASFKTNRVRKLYWALVTPAPESDRGAITAPLEKGGGEGREKMRVADTGQRARTEFRVLERLGTAAALVAFSPRTGRTHQIRAHAAYMGCPILGDTKYGGARRLPGLELKSAPALALHARRICAPHPVKTRPEIDATAPLPRALEATFRALGLTDETGAWDAFLDT